MDTELNDLLNKVNDLVDNINKNYNVEGTVNNLSVQSGISLDTYVDIEYVYNEFLNDLNKMIGLENVKLELRKMINYLIFLRRTDGKVNFDRINLNMVFRGNPGTGKTTVARIVSKIFSNLGFIAKDKIIETTSRDFIAGYIGQTAIKSRKLLDKARGGVIFIDEAYTFASGMDENNNNFAPEAIAEIIKEMEKKETIFIFSGYKKEMDNFINLNPGIKSRIGYDLTFEDYSLDDLYNMLINKINSSGLNISVEASNEIKNIIDDRKNIKNFGNGRMIDNLFDEILREHASINVNETNLNKLLSIEVDSIKKINKNKIRGDFFG